MNPNAILNAAVILQAKQELQNAIARKIALWAPRMADDEARKAFYKSLDKFLYAAEEVVHIAGLTELMMLTLHLTSYRPPENKQELRTLIGNVKKFSEHLTGVVKKSHPYKTAEYNTISLPYHLIAQQFHRFLTPVILFMDARMFDKLLSDWNHVAVEWKKELDEKLPLPEAAL